MPEIKKENIKKNVLHKWKNHIPFMDHMFLVIAFLLFGIFRPDIVMIIVYITIWLYFFLTQRKSLFKHFILASIISIIWNIAAQNVYGYNIKYIKIFGLNTFPLFTWAIGLLTGYVIYSHWAHKIKNSNFGKKIILFTSIYWVLLLLLETGAYYLFNIHNEATAMYTALPICNCIHAPPWMQASYFLLGPIYFSICYFLKLENPHIKKKET